MVNLSRLRLQIPVQLVIALLAMALAGCATSRAGKPEASSPFASASLEQILQAGDDALRQNQPERAVFIYMQALEIEQTAETWYRIGVGKGRLGDKAYAWKAQHKAVELDPNHAGAHEELGMLYMGSGQRVEARNHLQRATELDAGRWRAYNTLGVLADIDKQYATAVNNYQLALAANPDSSMLMNNIGYSYYLAGDLQQASHWMQKAIAATPDYEPAIKNMALLYARRGWYDQAITAFSRVVDPAQAYNDTGYIAMRNGDYDTAEKLLSEAIRMSPRYYPKANENLQQLREIRQPRVPAAAIPEEASTPEAAVPAASAPESAVPVSTATDAEIVLPESGAPALLSSSER